ncbi:hypothetical protein [Nonomuraea candida]|uniref:hypothetical protein n=1 Tax=Nonomuraea candida TaxID=359159 RepID=UPI0012FBE0DC|nr:hypothetical protein [Nonomuraea candida]
MLFSIASNFGEAPEWHQVVLGAAAVAGAVAVAAPPRAVTGRLQKKSFQFVEQSVA